MYSVAIQGTKGSYSEEATFNLFGRQVVIREYPSFFETFQAILLKQVDYAVIPVKNTIIGEITSAVNLYNQTDLKVFDEFPLTIKHFLVGTQDSQIDEIKSIRSHVAALEQCQRFLNKNPHIENIVASDTASSICRVVRDNIPDNAAIGSKRAAELYNGKILSADVADEFNNQTTFHLIG